MPQELSCGFFLLTNNVKKMNITVLCKVVDNYGDVGVVYRLVNQLKKLNPALKLNLVIDDLDSFKKINNSVILEKEIQNFAGYDVYNWNSFEFCYEKFSENDGEKLEIILECFQCGRPQWMEKILFEDKLQRTVNIIMIDYLTAEKYAEDFHCLKSLTRSAKVQKVNFMPGFTSKTGGLTIDEEWKELRPRNADGNILCFTYERDWVPLVNALNKYGKKKVMIAQGRGFQSLKNTFDSYESKTVIYEALDFINQQEWDKLMQSCSVLIIRGEESMSRACLSGIPFIWHAYPQSNEYQQVKVQALLERMKEYFSEVDFNIILKVWTLFNSSEKEVDSLEFESSIYNFLISSDKLEYGFKAFALDLRKNGDLAANLMTFIEKNIIIIK